MELFCESRKCELQIVRAMRFSMRKNCMEEEHRGRNFDLRKGRRERAAFPSRTTTISALDLSRVTGKNRETVRKIKNAVRQGNQESLEKLLDPDNHRPGRKLVLAAEEERMVSRRLMYAAANGFAADRITLQRIMGQIAADGRDNRYKKQIPSQSTIRRFRSRHRELTYRKYEHEDLAKMSAEKYGHVKTFKDMPQMVEHKYPGI